MMGSKVSTAAGKACGMRRAGCAALVAGLGLVGLLYAPMPALAADGGGDSAVGYTKEQAVYVKAAGDGSTQGVYVVNAVSAEEDGEVVDSGAYLAVENLSDESAIASRSGKVSFEAQAGETFYYQGELKADTELPWKVQVRYWLDGALVDASELGGATGHLKMELAITPAEQGDGAGGEDEDADGLSLSDFSDAYLLQVSATLPADDVSGLEADGSTRATSGDDVQLSYMVFPGKSLYAVVEADVADFTFDGWQIVGVPLALSIEVDSSDISAGSMDSVNDLKDGAVQLDEGAGELASGASDLKDGADTLGEGVSSLQDGAGQLSDGVGTLVSSGAKLVEASGEVDDGLAQLRDVAMQLNDAVAGMTDPGDGSVTALQTYAQTLSIGLATLDTKYDDLDQGIADYTAGVSQLKDGIATVSDGADQLADGATTLAQGAGDLKDGADELAEGTGELRTQTADIDDKIADGVTEGLSDYLNPDFEPRDFVSGEVGHVSRVQFVIKTAAIEEPEEAEEDETQDTAGEESRSFWDKLAALFKGTE